MLNLILLSSLSFLACTDGKDSGADDSSTTDSTGGTTDDSDTTIPEFSVSGSWTDKCSYTLSIENGSGDYFLGLAETGAGGDGWYGEDCGEGNACHPAGASGVTLTSVHPDCDGGGIDDIVAGSTTLFYQDLEAGLTYVVVDAATGECWAWGQDVNYYAAAGCTAI